jgi:glycosyltransferase involved in cell wall biosynthesis
MYTTVPPPASEDNDGSVVSIGRTLAGLDTLFEAAHQIEAPVIVVAGPSDRCPPPPARMSRFARNPHGGSPRRLRRAAVVVGPLLPAERSTGQVVMFEAMALGKPVVATRCIGTEDYIRDGENGLLVEPGDAKGLADAVNRLLRDPAWATRLAARALEDCRTRWMPDAHARRKLDAIAELAKARPHDGAPATA